MNHLLMGAVVGFVCTGFGYLVASIMAAGRIADIRREQMEASKRWSTEYAALQNNYYALLFKSGEPYCGVMEPSPMMYEVRTCTPMPPPDAANLATGSFPPSSTSLDSRKNEGKKTSEDSEAA